MITMVVSTFSIVVGNRACVNDCPLCISKMTGWGDITFDVCWDKFPQACRIAERRGARNVLLTSKGEATLFNVDMTRYLIELSNHNFERIELQTEGSNIAKGLQNNFMLWDKTLKLWKHLGLNVIAISMYHWDSVTNGEIFNPRDSVAYDQWGLIQLLRAYGFEIRVSVCLIKDTMQYKIQVDKMIHMCKSNHIMQLTLREMDIPNNPINLEVVEWIKEHTFNTSSLAQYINERGVLCDILPHGAKVYEIDGINVSITDGLAHDIKDEHDRNLIWFPTGILTTSWETVQGSRVL